MTTKFDTRLATIIVFAAWAVIGLLILTLGFTGFSLLDGLFGVYRNDIWQEWVMGITLYTFLASVLAITTMSIVMAVKKTLRVALAIVYPLATILIPIPFIIVAVYLPVHYSRPVDLYCTQGSYGKPNIHGVDCSYRFTTLWTN